MTLNSLLISQHEAQFMFNDVESALRHVFTFELSFSN